jgi:hypothetical protein
VEGDAVSWKVEVIADSTATWSGNQLRFATRAEAEHYAVNLMKRWTLVRTWRVIECDDPVNEPPALEPRWR